MCFSVSIMNKKKIYASLFFMLVMTAMFFQNAAINQIIHVTTVFANFGEYDVPCVYINTINGCGNTLTKIDGYIDAQIQVIDTDGSTVNSLGQVKVRGNSTANLEKKSYTIKFNNKYDLFNMGEAKKYALIANCLDPTLMRNILAFDFAESLSLHYTPQYTVAEVWMDEKYMGVYDLVEPIEAKPSRVNINTKTYQDFLIEYESARDEEGETYFSIGDWRFRIDEPKLPDEQELIYINGVMTNIADALKSGDYSQVELNIDTESFAKVYLLNELFKNVDFGWSSVYFYYQNGKLYAGPVWDFDLALGNVNPKKSANYKKAADPTGLYAADKHFYSYLFKYEEFNRKYIGIYAENYDYIENIYKPNGRIDIIAEQYKNVFNKNFSEADWEVSKVYKINMRVPDASYQENVDYLRSWISDRNEWMAGYYNIFEENVIGDINADGIFNVSDIVLLQKWLLAIPDTHLEYWKAADFCENDKLDVLDLSLMKKAIRTTWQAGHKTQEKQD